MGVRRLRRYRWPAFAVVALAAVALLSVPLRGHVVPANVALVVMAGVVAVGAWRCERAAALARAADDRTRDLRRLYRLASLSARGDDAADVIMAAQEDLIGLLGLSGCRFEAPPFATTFERLDRNGLVAWPDLHVGENGFELPRGGVELLVVGRGQLLGRFVMEPTPGGGASLEKRVVAIGIADQVGAALAAPPQGAIIT